MKKRNDGYFMLAEEYKHLYLKSDGDSFLFQLGSLKAVRGILLHVYAVMVYEKECLPIEKLPQGEKDKLWEEAKRISLINTEKYVVETCKVLHAFGTYLQL